MTDYVPFFGGGSTRRYSTGSVAAAGFCCSSLFVHVLIAVLLLQCLSFITDPCCCFAKANKVSDFKEEEHHHRLRLRQEKNPPMITSSEEDAEYGMMSADDVDNHDDERRQLFLSLFDGNNNEDSNDTPNLNINTINEQGFGDSANKYAWGMASFKGHLYVGTLNTPQVLWDIFLHFFEVESNGAKIYRGTKRPEGNGWTWETVLDFAYINPTNYGVRKMVVVNEFLYIVTANHREGLEVWKTSTGDDGDWTRVDDGQSGFGDTENISGRGMAVCGNYLYIGAENRKTGSQIWRRKLSSDGMGDIDNEGSNSWEEIMPELRGFGKDTNYFVTEFVLYKGSFYAGTLNGLFGGMELWKTNMCNETSASDVKFQKVFDGGLGNLLEFGVMTMININDKALVFGTLNMVQGASLYIDVGDEGTDFRPIFKRGNGSRLNGYIWSLEYYNGRLYVGTMHNLGLMVPWSTFQLFSLSFDEDTLEVTDLTKESTVGFGFFGPWGQLGIRNMQVHNDSLIIGTATGMLLSGTMVFEAISKEE